MLLLLLRPLAICEFYMIIRTVDVRCMCARQFDMSDLNKRASNLLGTTVVVLLYANALTSVYTFNIHEHFDQLDECMTMQAHTGIHICTLARIRWLNLVVWYTHEDTYLFTPSHICPHTHTHTHTYTDTCAHTCGRDGCPGRNVLKSLMRLGYPANISFTRASISSLNSWPWSNASIICTNAW